MPKTDFTYSPNDPIKEPFDLIKEVETNLIEELKDLLERYVAEYLDCKEDPEKDWQECTCENAKAVPIAEITKILEDKKKELK